MKQCHSIKTRGDAEVRRKGEGFKGVEVEE